MFNYYAKLKNEIISEKLSDSYCTYYSVLVKLISCLLYFPEGFLSFLQIFKPKYWKQVLKQ